MTLSAPKKKERMGTTAVESGRAAEGIEARAQGEKVFIFFVSAKFYENENAALSEIVRRKGNVKTDRFESCTSK